VRTITIFGFALALFGLIQSFTSPTKVYWFRELGQSTAFGPFINRHHFAAYMEMALALPVGLLLTGAVERDKRILSIFAALVMGVALIMTNSRGGIISLMAEAAFLVIMSGLARRASYGVEKTAGARSIKLRAALAFLLILILFAGAIFLGGEESLTRFLGTVSAEDPTTGRAHFWSTTLQIIRDHPIIGTGLGAFGVAYTRYDTRNGILRLEQAHNDYLQILSDAGMVGALLGCLFIYMLFRFGFARLKSDDPFRRGVALGALGGCFAVLIHSFFDFTLHTTANGLLFLVLAALATINGRVEQASHKRRRRRHHHHPTSAAAQGERASPKAKVVEQLVKE
jgi:O-antigen ligase